MLKYSLVLYSLYILKLFLISNAEKINYNLTLYVFNTKTITVSLLHKNLMKNLFLFLKIFFLHQNNLLMKHLFIILSISACSFFIGCTSGSNPIVPCDSIYLEITFKDKITNVDLTGDTSQIYNKDSIKYSIISDYDTTDILSPEVNPVGFYNEYSFSYYFGNKNGVYKILFYLNSTETDTITINTSNNFRLEYYYKNVLIKKEDGDCGYLNYTIKK